MTFSEFLCRELGGQRIPAARLSRAVGISKTQMCHIMSNRKKSSGALRKQICEYLQLPPDQTAHWVKYADEVVFDRIKDRYTEFQMELATALKAGISTLGEKECMQILIEIRRWCPEF